MCSFTNTHFIVRFSYAKIYTFFLASNKINFLNKNDNFHKSEAHMINIDYRADLLSTMYLTAKGIIP